MNTHGSAVFTMKLRDNPAAKLIDIVIKSGVAAVPAAVSKEYKVILWTFV
jgi:hypothetical protein